MSKGTVVGLIVLGLLTTATVQPAGGQTEPSPNSGAFSVRASIWGEVKHPGQYYFDNPVDLFELVSAAGGPTNNADIRRVLVLREKGGSRHIFNLPHLALSNQRFFLATGDVVVIPESFWSKFKNSLPVVTAAAAVANVAFTAILLAQR
ncbi:MAG: polysaccharide biosynthesis/export family protein [bacterium]